MVMRISTRDRMKNAPTIQLLDDSDDLLSHHDLPVLREGTVPEGVVQIPNDALNMFAHFPDQSTT
jgi:hypothetical protein